MHDAKSCHVFFIIIYANMIFIFIFERLGHMKFKIKLIFLMKHFCSFCGGNQFI
jgi:hypothetical protein